MCPFFCSPYCVYQMWCFLIPSTFQSHRQYYSHYCQISFLLSSCVCGLSHGILLPTLWHFLSNYNTTSTTVFVIQLQPRIYDFILLTYRFFFLAALLFSNTYTSLYFIQAQVIQLKQCIQHRKLVWFVCVLLGAFSNTTRMPIHHDLLSWYHH
jgi:Sec-independent protein secretion pathway component TatC